VIVVEDIVDTGITMNHLIHALEEKRPKSLQVATMFFKPGACQEKVQLDHVGMNVPNRFLVGYGLDYDGFGRNFQDVYELVNQ
jgi:hypoxanthine phosphoribosyltransferase